MPTLGRRKGTPWSGLPGREFQREVERLWPDDMRPPLGFGLPFLFGDGSDLNLTVTGTTSLASHDIKQYLNLTINAGGTLTTSAASAAVLIIFVRERLYIAGTVDMNGKGGATADGDDANRYAGSGGGGGSDAGAPGTGENGKNTLNPGGAGGVPPANPGVAGSALSTPAKTNVRMRTDTRNLSINSFGAAGGRGGSPVGWGGAGGNGGGGIIIFASEITVASGGLIRANGNAGGAANPTSNGGGGGGGGGFIYLITRRLTNSGSITVAGGAGGTSATGGAGGAGGAGTYILEQVP